MKKLGIALWIALFALATSNFCQAAPGLGKPGPVSGLSSEEAGVCDAFFLFTYLNDTTAVFFNNSPEYFSATWDFGPDAGILQEDAAGALVTFPADTTVVCLTITGEGGCMDEFCVAVFQGSEDELCQQTDCVWPGDTDGDLRANIYDLLNLGLGYGSMGPERPFFPVPGDPIAWAPNYSDDWSDWAGPVNFKHLDCNGDGAVDENDIAAIIQNYTPDFDYTSAPVPGAPPVYLELETSTLVISEGGPDFFTVTANLMVGDSPAPIDDLYGMALQVRYPLDLVTPNSMAADYEGDSFFGPAPDVMEVKADLYNYNLGRYDLAFSRKDGEGRDGYGKVATLQFIVNADIIDGRAYPDTTYHFTLNGIKFIDSAGNPLDFGFPADTASLTIVNDVIAGDSDALPAVSAPLLEVFPNPASDWLQIKIAAALSGKELELFDARGRRALGRAIDGPQLSLDLAGHAPGVYWLRVQTAEGPIVRKVLVKR